MNFASLGTIQVLDPSSGTLVGLDLSVLQEELHSSFRACSIQQEWMGDNLLGVLREKLREDCEGGVYATLQDVRRMLAGVLCASGFSDVAKVFIASGQKSEDVVVQEELTEQLRSWSPESLEQFLRSQAEIPPKMIPELLRRLPSMLSGVGFSMASESLVLEISRHLVHFLYGDNLSSSSVAVTSPVRYITKDAWEIPADSFGQELLDRRIVVLQPVSDILPVAVVQCHLLRLLDFASGVPMDESFFLSRLEGVSAFLQRCLVFMCGQMSSCWPDVQISGAVVRMMGFPGVLKILSSARHRKERRELGLRLEEAIRRYFSDAPFSVVVRFS